MSSDNVQGLENLEVWKKAKALCLDVYRQVLPKLPAEEKWNLGQQLRRAALSIPANIAEGHGRFYYQENIHFCYIARGSLIEVHSHLTVARALDFIPDQLFDPLKGQVEELVRMINGYIAYLKRSKRGENEPGSHLHIRESSIDYSVETAGRSEPPSEL